MRKAAVCIFVLTLAVSLPAQTFSDVTPLDPSLALRLIGQLNSRTTLPHAFATTNGSKTTLLFPAAGNLQGNFGTYYKSDVTLVNYDSVPQDVAVFWLPRDTTGVGITPVRITLSNDHVAKTWTDFVGTVLNRSGLGAILIMPIVGTDQDPVASIDGFSRIWTPQPNTTLGTVAQPFAPLDSSGFGGKNKATALGLRQDPKFRTNAGIVNADVYAHTFTIHVAGEKASADIGPIVIQPLSMTQVALPGTDFGALSLIFTVTDSSSANFGWAAYGTSSDNGTGDGWVSTASIAYTPAELQ